MYYAQKIIVLTFGLIVMARFSFGESNIKDPNVSGQFYDADPKRLSAMVDHFVSAAAPPAAGRPVRMILAPHAGYVYSGAVAGHSFQTVRDGQFKTVVIIAPSHFYGFDGVSVWKEGGFKTPLGTVAVDTEFTGKLIGSNEEFYFEPQAFEREHSLEVEIPFLQRTLKDFKIVPVIMGQASYETCAALATRLKEIIAGRTDVLIVISTDLSHYHDDTFARKMDRRTLEAVAALDSKKVWQECRVGTMEMCGCVPVTTAMIYAKLNGLSAQVLKYANSGDVTDDKTRVVGYSSVIFSGGKTEAAVEGVAPLSKEQKRRLIGIARSAIEEIVHKGKVFKVTEKDQRLQEHEGAFVTIHRKEHLRGCIGHIIGDQPLYLTVRDMAVAAATEDPRFPTMSKEELVDMDVEISVLSKPRVTKDVNEIVLSVHGVIIGQGARRGLFLPQVATDTGWSREEFLSELCEQKAGLPRDCWKDPKTHIEIFTADVFGEKDVE